MTDTDDLTRERDALLALLREVQSIANRPTRFRWSGNYESSCAHAIAEIQNFLNPHERQDLR